MAKWLLLMDLDGTAWDNMDVSRCRIPFKKIDSDTIQDSNGTVIRLERWPEGISSVVQG
jgi:Predicted phosphatase